MRVQLTNDYNTPFALSNDFKEVPLFLADLEEECVTVEDMLNTINEYSMYRNWSIKRKYTKKIIFDSKDALGNVHYLILRSE